MRVMKRKALAVAGEHLTDGAVVSSPSWQLIGAEWYLAVGSQDKKVHVLKFDSNANGVRNALTLTDEHLTGGQVDSSPSWKQIGNEWYLAVGSNDKNLHVLKFGKKIKRGSGE